MPKVTFTNDDLTVEAEEGANLKDVAESSGATIPFGCEQGICGTCLINAPGQTNLSEMEENEQETLEAMGAEPEQRLACQCQVKGDVDIESAY